MLKKLIFYSKVGFKLMKKDIVDEEDYRKGYNQVAGTYENWLEKMGQFTEKIIEDEYIYIDKKVKILDFACGTGYISKKILGKDLDCQVTAVDYSEKMLEELRKISDDRLEIVNSEGIKFLKMTNESYDSIYFGWALSYFNHRELFKLFRKILKPNGTLHIITNVQGTLSEIEDIFLRVMYKNQDKLAKPMDIKFKLPSGKEGLSKWLDKSGFDEIKTGEKEIRLFFDEPEELLDWISKTGAIAGTAYIFKDYNSIKKDLLDEIRKRKYKDGKYIINHKFAYGIYRRG